MIPILINSDIRYTPNTSSPVGKNKHESCIYLKQNSSEA